MDFIKVENRIYSVNDKNEVIAEITYEEIEKGIYNINHTYVHESLRGQKIGEKLVKLAIEEIKNRKGKVQATCSYAKHYLEKTNRKSNDL